MRTQPCLGKRGGSRADYSSAVPCLHRAHSRALPPAATRPHTRSTRLAGRHALLCSPTTLQTTALERPSPTPPLQCGQVGRCCFCTAGSGHESIKLDAQHTRTRTQSQMGDHIGASCLCLSLLTVRHEFSSPYTRRLPAGYAHRGRPRWRPASVHQLHGWHRQPRRQHDLLHSLPGLLRLRTRQATKDNEPRETLPTNGPPPLLPAQSGTYSPAGSPSCLPCPRGHYNPQPSAAQCTACPTGSAQPNEGKTTCGSCLPGTYAAGEGADHCDECPVGSYGTIRRAASCTLCAIGHYQVRILCGLPSLSPSTLPPPPAPFPPARLALPYPRACCGMLEHSAHSPSPPTPSPPPSPVLPTSCSAHSFPSDPSIPLPFRLQNVTGQTSCMPAEAGSFVDVEGAERPVLCPAGTYNPTTGSGGARLGEGTGGRWRRKRD